MNIKVFSLQIMIGFLVLLMAAPPGILAQSSGMGATFRQEELDQMLAPIALYPDSLLAQILVAATYPAQVSEASQWVRQYNNLAGNELNAALDVKNWDLSVKALVPFPQVLYMMSDKIDWTQRMGDAFMAQQADVMDTIQRLRAKAHAQGNLNTTDQQRVVVRGESIEILPANPRVVYVPTYDPSVIYGPWWYASYPPYAYNPYYPGYAYDPYYTGAGFIMGGIFGFAAGVAVGSVWNSGWGHWDWGRRDVNINTVRNININRNDLSANGFRTTSWNNAVRQGTVGSSRHDSLRNTTVQNTGTQGVRSRPSAVSVQQGLQQRQSRDQAYQGGKKKMATGTGQPGSTMSSGKSKGQMGSTISSKKSSGQTGSTMSSGRSKGQMRSTMSSERSKGLRGSTMSSGKASGQMGNTMSSGKSSAKMGNAMSSGKSGGGGAVAVSHAPGGGGKSGESHGKHE